MQLTNITKCEALFFLSKKISSKIFIGDHHEKQIYNFKKLRFERKKNEM